MPAEAAEVAAETTGAEVAAETTTDQIEQAAEQLESQMEESADGSEAAAGEGDGEQSEATGEQREESALEHGYKKSISRATRQRDEARAELERLKAENEQLRIKAEGGEDARLVEQAKSVSEGLKWLRANRAAYVQDAMSRHGVDEETAGRMYQYRRDEMADQQAELSITIAQRAMAAKSRGTQTVNTTTTTRPQAKLTVQPRKNPPGVAPGGAAGGGSAVRGAGAHKATQDNFSARAKQVGEVQAAEEAMAAMRI